VSQSKLSLNRIHYCSLLAAALEVAQLLVELAGEVAQTLMVLKEEVAQLQLVVAVAQLQEVEAEVAQLVVAQEGALVEVLAEEAQYL